MHVKGLFPAMIALLAAGSFAKDSLAGTQQNMVRNVGAFNAGIFSATECVKMGERKLGESRALTAANICKQPVSVLSCFNILKKGPGYNRTGWFCDYSSSQSAGKSRVVAQMITYRKKTRAAACFVGDSVCETQLRTIYTQILDKPGDPEEVARRVLR